MRILTKTIARVLDFLFPPECLACGKEDFWVCPTCLCKITPEIRKLSQQPKPFEQVWVLADYKNPLVAKIIRRLKFAYCRDVLRDLRPFLATALHDIRLPADAILVPVPLHRLRQNNRGFNQAQLIAELFGEINRSPVQSLLKRVRNTIPQTLLSAEKRRVNLADAFLLEPRNALKLPRTTPIILIDDVATTMSTLLECAKPLQQAGFKNLSAIVIARSSE